MNDFYCAVEDGGFTPREKDSLRRGDGNRVKREGVNVTLILWLNLKEDYAMYI